MFSGLYKSCVLHLILVGVIFVCQLLGELFEKPDIQKVYSVTLEGGLNLGGLDAVSKDNLSKMKSVGAQKHEKPTPKPIPTPVKTPVKEVQTPTAKTDKTSEITPKLNSREEVSPEEADFLIDKQKPTATPTATIMPKATPTAKPTAKPTAAPTAAPTVKPTAAPTRVPTSKPTAVKVTPQATPQVTNTQKPAGNATKQIEPQDVDSAYESAINKYLGGANSHNGGGPAGKPGAARLGGNSFGGGEVRPPEFFRYRNMLQAAVKSGWKWYDRSVKLQATAQIEISPSGRIVSATIVDPSGNPAFDKSLQRAIWQANPLPPPPQSVYKYFKTVSMVFVPDN